MIYVNDSNQATGETGNWETHSNYSLSESLSWITTSGTNITATDNSSSSTSRSGTVKATQDRSGYYVHGNGGINYSSDPSSRDISVSQESGMISRDFQINFQAQLGDYWGLDRNLSISITITTDVSGGGNSCTDKFCENNEFTLSLPIKYIKSDNISYSGLVLKKNGTTLTASETDPNAQVQIEYPAASNDRTQMNLLANSNLDGV